MSTSLFELETSLYQPDPMDNVQSNRFSDQKGNPYLDQINSQFSAPWVTGAVGSDLDSVYGRQYNEYIVQPGTEVQVQPEVHALPALSLPQQSMYVSGSVYSPKERQTEINNSVHPISIYWSPDSQSKFHSNGVAQASVSGSTSTSTPQTKDQNKSGSFASQNGENGRFKRRMIFHLIAIVLVLIGAICLGVLGIFECEPLEELNKMIFKSDILLRGVYIIIGIAALFLLFSKNTYLPFLGESVLPSAALKQPYHNYDSNNITIVAGDAQSVVYWAAEAEGKKETPEEAYGSYENSGIVPVIDGKATLYFKCPGQYKVGSLWKMTLPKHVHFRLVYDNHISEVHTVVLDC
jgi:uncharacterized membrane protein YuzA (DUF378 family)